MIRRLIIILLLQQVTVAYAETGHGPYKPQGSYVNFDIYSLYYHCEGGRGPTAVIEGGIGYSLAEWQPIQQALAPHLRTCVYDRAGYGMSYRGNGARTAAQIADELYDLLKVADIPGPYILVGHSFGGYVVQYFAKKNPHLVAGMVLVDSSHPDQVHRLAELDAISNNEYRGLINGQTPVTSIKPEDAQSYWHMLNRQRKAIFTQMDELKYFRESAEQVRDAGVFPDIPLAVITRGQQLLPATEEGHSLEQEWRDMQRELVTLSKQGWQTVAANSGHSIHIDAPDVVIEEVLRVLDKVTEPAKYSGVRNN